MIKLFYASEKTNSFYPEPWNWSTDPFPAFRGAGQRYRAFLAVANGFTPWFSSDKLSDNQAMSDDLCKIITTKKGTRLLVPCSAREDERIMLITARGGFRGGFGAIEAVGGEILWKDSMAMHCTPVAHIIARITDPNGYVFTETGRRCSTGQIDVFSWKGGYFEMPTEEYKVAVEMGTVLASHDTIREDLERCKAIRREQAESRKRRPEMLPKFEAINARREVCSERPYELGETFFTEYGWGGGVIGRYLYTEKELARVEEKLQAAEKRLAEELAEKEYSPQFKAAIRGYGFPNGKHYGDPKLEFYTNVVRVWHSTREEYVRYNYSAEGLEQFKRDIPIYEAEYQAELREQAEAEAKAKAEAEEKARIAAAEAEAKAKKEKAEAEAKAMGLPSNIRLWHRSGATHAGKAWVIDERGMERGCDFVDTMVCGSNSKRYHQSYEGDHVWNQILPGELVIYWAHAFTAAEHDCQVIHRPDHLTEAQLERVAEIQNELEEEFNGRKGLTGARTCPSIGDGWGLF